MRVVGVGFLGFFRTALRVGGIYRVEIRRRNVSRMFEVVYFGLGMCRGIISR